MGLILDTSVVLSGGVRVPDTEQVAISVVTLGEIHFGVLVARSPEARGKRLRQLARAEHTFTAYPVNHEVAIQYGRLSAAIRATGRNPRSRTADLLIAATAVVHDAVLWTRNARDLDGLDGLVRIHAVG